MRSATSLLLFPIVLVIAGCQASSEVVGGRTDLRRNIADTTKIEIVPPAAPQPADPPKASRGKPDATPKEKPADPAPTTSKRIVLQPGECFKINVVPLPPSSTTKDKP